MEEGGGILCNYNGDRLATAAYKHKQSRRWIASGCNIFGQLDITKDHCLKIQQFEGDYFNIVFTFWNLRITSKFSRTNLSKCN